MCRGTQSALNQCITKIIWFLSLSCGDYLFAVNGSSAMLCDTSLACFILMIDTWRRCSGHWSMGGDGLAIVHWGRVSVKQNIWTGKECKSLEFPRRNCTVAWNKVIIKYNPHIALFLLKLKSKFCNKMVESIEKDPDG